jgi:hypothetical protein
MKVVVLDVVFYLAMESLTQFSWSNYHKAPKLGEIHWIIVTEIESVHH